MNIKVTGKDLEVTDAIRAYVEKKMERIEKYFDNEFDVVATVKNEKTEKVAEIRVAIKGDLYKAVTAHKDLYAAIDKDIDILEGQIRKYKTKKEKMYRDASTIAKEEMQTKAIEIEDEVIKELYYSIRPMGIDDAKLKLQEKPNDKFLAFINIETGKVNVIYKLNDSKNYGLVVPEE